MAPVFALLFFLNGASESESSFSCTKRPIEVTSRIEEGNPQKVIVQVAETVGANFIVMGSRGRGPIESAVLGSVSTNVVRYAPCSVIIAKKNNIAKNE